MKKSGIVKSASLVTALSVLERALGFLYRIVLARLIGSEGMGLYQLALSVFAVFLTACSSGVPVTVSRLISKFRTKGDIRGERQTVSSALLVTLALAVPLFFMLYFGHGWGFLFSDKRAEGVFSILMLGFLFDCTYSVVRGSFWGNKQFVAYSLIEFVEEVVKVSSGVILIVLFSVSDAADGAKFAALAVVLSYVSSFALSLIYFIAKGGKFASPLPKLKPLLSSAAPITAMRTSTSLVSSFVAMLLPVKLMESGLSSAEAMSAYGETLGMAMPVLFTPTTLVGSIGLVLTPYLSEAFYKKEHTVVKEQVEKTLAVSAAIACFFIPYFFLFGEEIGVILFSSHSAGKVISDFAFMLLPLSVGMIVTGILNSMNLEKYTLAVFFLGAAAMLSSIWFLTPVFGVYSMPIGQSADFTICAVVGVLILRSKCKRKPKLLGAFLFPALFTLALCLIFAPLYAFMLRISNFFIAAFVCGTPLLLLQAGYFVLFLRKKGFLMKK